MTTLEDLCGMELELVNVTKGGNIFAGGNKTCLLKPVNRAYKGVSKKPLYFIEALENGKATYLSGLFRTKEKFVFSGDYKDDLGLKHMVKIKFSDDAQVINIKAA